MIIWTWLLVIISEEMHGNNHYMTCIKMYLLLCMTSWYNYDDNILQYSLHAGWSVVSCMGFLFVQFFLLQVLKSYNYYLYTSILKSYYYIVATSIKELLLQVLKSNVVILRGFYIESHSLSDMECTSSSRSSNYISFLLWASQVAA